MNQVEVLDNGVVLNGNLLTFPLSYEDIRALFGEARINVQSDNHFEYFYDEFGVFHFREVKISMMNWEYRLRGQLHIFGT